MSVRQAWVAFRSTGENSVKRASSGRIGRSILPTIALLLFAAPLAAQSDGALRLLRRPDARGSVPTRELLSDAPAALQAGAVAIERTPDGRTLVGVLVRVVDSTAIDALRAAGARITSIAGDVVSARMPIDALDRLDAVAGIRAAQAARVLALKPQADESMRAIQADALRSYGPGGWSGTTGEGTLIGVYDTGLDVQHPDFVDDTGASRVRSLWDQTRSGTPPAGYGYGHHCTHASLQALVDSGTGCPQRDVNGHGTHVTGTAAGDGSALSDRTYAGVAPEAELVVVKGGDGFFSETRMVDGLVWLRDQAQALGRPMVVNVSISSQSGPHDGTRLLERAIDNLSRPGFVVVVASGNDGQNANTAPPQLEPHYFHARRFASAAPSRMTFEVPTYSATLPCDFNIIALTMWYDASDSVEVTVVRPNSARTSAAMGSTVTDDAVGGRVIIDNASAGPDPENNGGEVVILIDGCEGGGPPVAGIWSIEVQSRAATPSGAPIDLWLNTRFIVGQRIFGREGFDNRLLVGSPGSARSAITVGAFASRMCWPGTNSSACYTEREAIGDLARFSSGGPSRDGRTKPEIVAPGIAVMSARSTGSSASPLRTHPSGAYVAYEGTSMAAPHVTGTVSLLMQHVPALGHVQARDILMRTATRDNFTARTYGPGFGAMSADWWGAGKLDACAAVLDVAAAAVTGVRVAPAADSLPQGARLQLKVCAPGGPSSLAWTSTAPGVASVDAQGVVHAVAPGDARIIGMLGGVADTARIVVVPAATLVMEAVSLAPSQLVRATRNSRIPLLHIRLSSDGVEATELIALGLELSGVDPDARVLLMHADSMGEINESAPLVAAQEILLNGAPQKVALRPTPPLRVPARDTTDLVLVLLTSGAVPNGTRFSARIDPQSTESIATRSEARDRLTISASAVSFETTVLAADRELTFSANPVRQGPVNFAFRGCPVRASIHTLTGALVRDLMPLVMCGADGGSASWNLNNGEGGVVAPGMYLVLFDMDGRMHREKLMVLRTTGAGQEE